MTSAGVHEGDGDVVAGVAVLGVGLHLAGGGGGGPGHAPRHAPVLLQAQPAPARTAGVAACNGSDNRTNIQSSLQFLLLIGGGLAEFWNNPQAKLLFHREQKERFCCQ